MFLPSKAEFRCTRTKADSSDPVLKLRGGGPHPKHRADPPSYHRIVFVAKNARQNIARPPSESLATRAKMSTPLLFALAASACFLAIACDTVLPDVTHPGHRVTDTEDRPVQEESHADSDGNDFTHVVEDVTRVVEDVTHADNDASHADSDATTENDYQDLFKVLNMGIANTLRGMRRAPFYNLAPNMFLVRNNLSNKGMNEGIEGEPVTRVVSLVQLAKSADALFESHSLYCLLSDKTGLQIARAPGNGELGVRIKKIDDRFENEIQGKCLPSA